MVPNFQTLTKTRRTTRHSNEASLGVSTALNSLRREIVSEIYHNYRFYKMTISFILSLNSRNNMIGLL